MNFSLFVETRDIEMTSRIYTYSSVFLGGEGEGRGIISPPHFPPSRHQTRSPRAGQRIGGIAITFGVAVTFAYFGVRDVCEMSTIIKLPVARDQRASRNRRKFHYTRGNSKFIGHRISRSRSSRGIAESDFDWKKKVAIYLRDRIGEWVDSDIIEASFNPIRIYDFYGISLWMQLIAGGIKAFFHGSYNWFERPRGKATHRISEFSLSRLSLQRSDDAPVTLPHFSLFIP